MTSCWHCIKRQILSAKFTLHFLQNTLDILCKARYANYAKQTLQLTYIQRRFKLWKQLLSQQSYFYLLTQQL